MSKALLDLLKECSVERLSASVAAGQATTNGSSVDMQNYEGVLFIALIGSVTATGTFKMHAEQSLDDGASDPFADLESSEVDADSDDDDKMVAINVHRPQERYVRPVVITATADGEIDGILAIKYGPRKQPITQSASHVVASTSLTSPDEGTK